MKPSSLSSLPQGVPVFMASPRKGGNCSAIAASLEQALLCRGLPLHSVPLYEYRITPCIACDTCQQTMHRRGTARTPLPLATGPRAQDAGGIPAVDEWAAPFLHAAAACASLEPPFGCPLAAGDDSLPLYEALVTAPAVFVVAPVFFYHVPAHFKALIDRLQTFWRMAEAGFPPLVELPPRSCYPVLIAGRKQGERLFEGSLLTLKQAVKPLGLTLEEPLLLRGLDGPEDFLREESAGEAFAGYIERLTRTASLLTLRQEPAPVR